MKLSTAFTFLAAACAFATASASDGKTIYYNGKVFTSDTRHLWAEGLVVEGERIVAVGTTREVLAFNRENDSKLVDLQQHTLIPGFNDAHVHPFDNTSFPHAVQLNSAAEFIPGPGPSLDDVVALIRAAAEKDPSDTWFFVSIGTNVVENPAANRRALDAVSGNHPVLLAAWYGHGTYLNTAALRRIGIGEEEPDPFGGFYERFPGTNTVNGVAHEYAEHQIRRFFASQMTDAEFVRLFENFATGAAQMGYTSLQEFSVGLPQQRHLDLLAQSRLPIRWRAVSFPLALDEPVTAQLPHDAGRRAADLRSSGIKWIVDASFIERLAFLRQDYADAPGFRGTLNFPAGLIRSALARSAHGAPEKTQLLVHSVGDGTSDTILDAMGAIAPDAAWRARRPRIEHGILLRPDRYESARQKGVFVVQNPLHLALREINQVRLAPEVFADVDPMQSLLKAGIKLALGSDSVTTPGNPYLDLFFAVNHFERPAEALTIEQAVIAYTRTAAEAEFQEQRKGTLAPGKLADFVVLSQDIFALAPSPALIGTRPLLTVVGGKVVFDAGVIR